MNQGDYCVVCGEKKINPIKGKEYYELQVAKPVGDANYKVHEPSTEKKEENTRSGRVVLMIIIGIVIAIIAAAIISFLYYGDKDQEYNPYTKDYIAVSGQTIGDVADQLGMEYSQFLDYYGLPEDMPETTSERAAYYNMSVGAYAENFSGMAFEELKGEVGWSDDITAETTLGDALDSMTVGQYLDGESIDEFKETYDLDDSVTADTSWKEVRNIVDTKLKEQYDAAKVPESAQD